MAPSILIIGSTGNTGAAAVRALPNLLAKSSKLSHHRILACTRNAKGNMAQELARVPGVQVVEINWTEIDANWLREHQVERLYSACHNEATQFMDESLLYNAVREAGVDYAVRLSTTHEWVSADNLVPYGRSHWAIETMLEDASFSSLKWTSLQPMIFSAMVAAPGIKWLQHYRKTGQKQKLEIMLGENKAVPALDASEVGIFAAHLLASDDPSVYDHQKIVLVGPKTVTGRQIVDLVETHAGTKVEEVEFNSVASLDQLDPAGYPSNMRKAMKHAIRRAFEDGSGAPNPKPTSEEALALYAPKNSVVDYLEKGLASAEK